MPSSNPGFYSNFKAPKIPTEDGRVAAATSQLMRQNQQLAFAVQAQVAQVIERKIQRKAVTTGRLIKATLAPENAVYNDKYVGVGKQSYLDTSIAKYWRTIEEGSAATWTKRSFLSLELQGLWGLNTASWRVSGRGSAWVALGGKNERAGEQRQEMYHPFRRGKGSKLPVFHPGHEIRPMRAYAYVKRNKQWDARAVENSRQYIKTVLGRDISPAGFPG